MKLFSLRTVRTNPMGFEAMVIRAESESQARGMATAHAASSVVSEVRDWGDRAEVECAEVFIEGPLEVLASEYNSE